MKRLMMLLEFSGILLVASGTMLLMLIFPFAFMRRATTDQSSSSASLVPPAPGYVSSETNARSTQTALPLNWPALETSVSTTVTDGPSGFRAMVS